MHRISRGLTTQSMRPLSGTAQEYCQSFARAELHASETRVYSCHTAATATVARRGAGLISMMIVIVCVGLHQGAHHRVPTRPFGFT